jgi:hypothetical protein
MRTPKKRHALRVASNPVPKIRAVDRTESTAQFIQLATLVWERHYGPLPDGLVITFRDFNPKNWGIDNLLAITAQERLDRNRELPGLLRQRVLFQQERLGVQVVAQQVFDLQLQVIELQIGELRQRRLRIQQLLYQLPAAA